MTPPRSLTQRRRDATRLDIARVAARLFADCGTSEVTAERIAEESGVSTRTFYRYFTTKEEAVTPLLRVGAELWHDALASAAPGDPRQIIPETLEQVLALDGPDGAAPLEPMRGLLRAAGEDPALQAVWRRAHEESERTLRPIIAGLVPDAEALTVRLLSTAATEAIRLGLELWADEETTAPHEAPATTAHRAFAQLSAGIAVPR